MAEAGDLSGERPAVILARTLKGRGASEVEDREDWHGKPLPPDMAERAIVELGGERHLVVRDRHPPRGSRGVVSTATPRSSCPPTTAARRWLPARPTGRRWPRSARGPTSSRWMAR